MKLTNQQFKFVSELIWGGVPVDRVLAEESALFKQEAPKILEKYPMLDKSFFEIHKNDKDINQLPKETTTVPFGLPIDLKDYHKIEEEFNKLKEGGQ